MAGGAETSRTTNEPWERMCGHPQEPCSRQGKSRENVQPTNNNNKKKHDSSVIFVAVISVSNSALLSHHQQHRRLPMRSEHR